MTAPQQFMQSKLLMAGRDGLMLSEDEIKQLDWSVFDEVDISKPSPERLDAVHLMNLQINKLRNP